jgi:hypothetical protein
MKRVLTVFLALVIFSAVNAQFNESSGSIKLGAGYAKDFPGLSGYGITGEFSMNMSERLEGAVGLKRFNMQGYPRNNQVNEYTRATTIDFNIFYLPLVTESHIVRVGTGYAFSFYSMRRSYPVITSNGTEKQTSWPVQDSKSRTSGLSAIGEYEYLLPNSNISLGLRAAWYKAYDRVTYVGTFVGWRL